MADPYAGIAALIDPYAGVGVPLKTYKVTQGGRTVTVQAESESAARAAADAQRRTGSTPAWMRPVSQGAAIGIADEIDARSAQLETGVTNFVGRVTGRPGAGYTGRQAYDAVMDAEKAARQQFASEHPKTSFGLELAGGLLSPAAKVGGKYIAAGRGVGAVGRGAVVGGAAGAAYGAGSADPGQRMQGARDGAVVGAVTGGAAPVVIAGAGKAVKGAVRVANRASGGRLLDPNQEALVRLSEALRKDRLTPNQITQAMNEWQRVGGPSPAFLDLVGENTKGLIRGAAMTGEGRNAAVQYGRRVAGDMQDIAVDRTRQLSPDGRSLSEIDDNIQTRIAGASTAPSVPPGSGGRAVSDGLNTRFDQARTGVNNAYGMARQAEPERAHFPASHRPVLAAEIREAVRDFSMDDVPRVGRALADLDALSTPTMRDLFDSRSRLSNLRMSADPVERAAASRALAALDRQIDDVASSGAMTGDPDAVNLWRDAIEARADMGRQFEGDDLIQALTERDFRGGGRTNAIAPEDASSAVLGRNGVSPRANLERDLTRIRDLLGPQSPEWHALQAETAARLLGVDAGSEAFGSALQAFERQNPGLASLLISPGTRTSVAQSQQAISGAVADRGSSELGRRILSTPSGDFAAGVGSTANPALLQASAARGLENAIEAPAGNATGVLNRIATSTRQGENLRSAFGQGAADDYRQATSNLIEQVNNARFINPNSNSQTAGRLFDAGLVDLPPLSKSGLLSAMFKKLREGVGLTDAERGAIVQFSTQGATPGLLSSLPQQQLPNYRVVAPISGLLGGYAAGN